MSDLSWAATVRLVHERAHHRCEYCQTPERAIGQPMHVEHIIPNGEDSPDNLCLSCSACNLSKARAVSAPDPDSGEIVSLFKPRTQIWSEHFEWRQDGKVVYGLTPTGRATVARLKMNLLRMVEARTIWIIGGVHPPK